MNGSTIATYSEKTTTEHNDDTNDNFRGKWYWSWSSTRSSTRPPARSPARFMCRFRSRSPTRFVRFVRMNLGYTWNVPIKAFVSVHHSFILTSLKPGQVQILELKGHLLKNWNSRENLSHWKSAFSIKMGFKILFDEFQFLSSCKLILNLFVQK